MKGSIVLIRDPYIGMPIIINTDDSAPGPGGCCCCDGGNGGNGGNSGNSGNGGAGGDTPDIDVPGGEFPGGGNGEGEGGTILADLPLAMCYVPMQRWNTTYPLDRALTRGTIFPELDLPFTGGRER